MPSSVRFRSRSEEHTSELQSLRHLAWRLLLEQKTRRPSAIVLGESCPPGASPRLGPLSPHPRSTANSTAAGPRETGSGTQLFGFFFNDPATPEIYTLSLHGALPI